MAEGERSEGMMTFAVRLERTKIPHIRVFAAFYAILTFYFLFLLSMMAIRRVQLRWADRFDTNNIPLRNIRSVEIYHNDRDDQRA